MSVNLNLTIVIVCAMFFHALGLNLVLVDGDHDAQAGSAFTGSPGIGLEGLGHTVVGTLSHTDSDAFWATQLGPTSTFSPFDAVVVEQQGFDFTPQKLNALRDYALNGGRLVLLADQDIHIPLNTAFGFSFTSTTDLGSATQLVTLQATSSAFDGGPPSLTDLSSTHWLGGPAPLSAIVPYVWEPPAGSNDIAVFVTPVGVGSIAYFGWDFCCGGTLADHQAWYTVLNTVLNGVNPTGSCCIASTSCTDDVIETDCTGEWTEGGTCETTCGACCGDTGCDDFIDINNCTVAGTVTFNANQTCTESCVGACCGSSEVGGCVDASLFEDCSAPSQWSRDQLCSTSCTGACCGPNETNGCGDNVLKADCASDWTANELCDDVCDLVGIVINLDMQPDTPQDIHFTHNVQHGGEFSLDDDSTATLDNSITLYGSAFNQFRVTVQGVANNYVVAAIKCDDDADVNVELDHRRVLINLKDKQLTCTFVIAALGACCSSEATNGCVEDVTKDQCLKIDSDAVWTLGGECTQQQCPRGACCEQDGSCHDRSSPDVCANNGGSFNGLATKCNSNTCGACCGGNTAGGCADAVAATQCDSTATHVPNKLCEASCGACCQDSTCTPRAVLAFNRAPCDSFILGDYECNEECGSCCGGDECQDNKFKSQCDVNSEFSLGSCDDTCGACCDNGSCQLRLDTSCNNGVFQGTGSACTSNTCPLGSVCCQDNINQPCLTGANDVEQCTGENQFAAQHCGQCFDRFSDLELTIMSQSNEISLSGADNRKRNVESSDSSSSSSTSSSSYSTTSTSSSRSSRCSSSSSSSSFGTDCPLIVQTGVSIRNKTPEPYSNVVIEVVVTIPRTATVISTDAEFGTFEWKQQKIHGDTVTGHGEWTIARLPADDRALLNFEVELKSPKVGDQVVLEANVVSSQPAALSVEKSSTTTIVE